VVSRLLRKQKAPGSIPGKIHLIFLKISFIFCPQAFEVKMMDHDSFNLQDEVSARYKKIERIGKGTYGVVYRAIDAKSNEEVALKKMIIHVD
jgi:serine/threonine protein kinase